ncbi:MAG TPA: heat shock protein HspQ [Candidatus Omnitrophota bacterium]|nr:heat shock protein HspQ [Candidatus Omnitrophota bacterium]
MVDPKQIPHLIKLLDDESSNVREAVIKELELFGPSLKDELKKIVLPLNSIQKGYINEIWESHKRIWINRVWPSWLSLLSDQPDFSSDYKRLESGLSIFAEFLSGVESTVKLKRLLDELALAYQIKFRKNDPVRLARFLFKERKFHGDEENYYDPQNSNLIHVIKEKKGTPISLAAVYMLVGLRLGIKIEGCHFPGHFLARIPLGVKKVFVDCFNGGQIIEKSELLNMQDGMFRGMEQVLNETADARTMISQVLANLIRAYQVRNDEKTAELLIALFKDMDTFMIGKQAEKLTPEDIINCGRPLFKPGECVVHARYGYRGIVVEVDPECQATDSWYYSNQTQPSRYQAWYHVLVHGSDQVTYVAQDHLVQDPSLEKVDHVLLSHFFTKDKKGRYVRNDNPWPETDF